MLTGPPVLQDNNFTLWCTVEIYLSNADWPTGFTRQQFNPVVHSQNLRLHGLLGPPVLLNTVDRSPGQSNAVI